MFEAADEVGAQVLGYDPAPHPATAAFLTPASTTCHEVTGEPWLWFTLTASDQVLDLCRAGSAPSRTLRVRAGDGRAVCELLGLRRGDWCGAASARELHMGTIHAGSDHGMPRQADGSAAAMVERYVVPEHWLEGGGRSPHGAYLAGLEGHDPDTGDGDAWTQFLLHGTTSGTPRPRRHHPELRAARQQPTSTTPPPRWAPPSSRARRPSPPSSGTPWAPTPARHARLAPRRHAPGPAAPGPTRPASAISTPGGTPGRPGLGEESRMAPLYARLDAGMNPPSGPWRPSGGRLAPVALAARR